MNLDTFNKFSTAKIKFADRPVEEFLKSKDTIQYLLASNGLFILVNLLSFAVLKQTNITYKYFNNDLVELNEDVFIKFPKIPIKVLSEVVDIFSSYSHEVYCVLYYDRKRRSFVLHFPEQKCTSASVQYNRNNNKYAQEPDRYLKCIDFHSHPFSHGCYGHSVNHSSVDVRDSLENLCISCVVDPKIGICASTFKFEAPVPIIKEFITISESKILDLESSKFKVEIDYDPERIEYSELDKNEIIEDHDDYCPTDEFVRMIKGF